MCWLTVPVVNIDRAKAFYAEIFNWETSPEAVPSNRPGVKELHHFNRGKTLHGAFCVMEDGFHVINQSMGSTDAISVHPSFHVKNCKDTLEEVERLGGKKHLYVGSPFCLFFLLLVLFLSWKEGGLGSGDKDENGKSKVR